MRLPLARSAAAEPFLLSMITRIFGPPRMIVPLAREPRCSHAMLEEQHLLGAETSANAVGYYRCTSCGECFSVGSALSQSS